MRFTTLFVAIAAFATAASAANIQGRQFVPPPELGLKGEPNDLRNCPGSGVADACNLERPCNRIRINYGTQMKGHYVWYNYNTGDIPKGVNVGTEASCSDF
ncbi:hypothetical protein PM082_024510 [Marasmius tenuissimus]|nr:hypothetical protein PM082_024510 [Marasmius tenuissimus]